MRGRFDWATAANGDRCRETERGDFWVCTEDGFMTLFTLDSGDYYTPPDLIDVRSEPCDCPVCEQVKAAPGWTPEAAA